MCIKQALPRLLLAACTVIAVLCLALAAGFFDAPQRQMMTLAPLPSARPTATQQPGGIPINTATAEELQSLPGIGPYLAQQIIEARERSPFFYPEDLKNVPGIGDKRLAQIRPYIRID